MIEEGRHCGMCGVTVSEHHVQLARRVEQMEVSDKDGKPLQSIRVFSDDVLLEFCDHACCSGRQQDVVAAFELKPSGPLSIGCLVAPAAVLP